MSAKTIAVRRKTSGRCSVCHAPARLELDIRQGNDTLFALFCPRHWDELKQTIEQADSPTK